MIEGSGGINTQLLPPSFTDGAGKLTVPKEKAAEFSAGIQARIADMPPAEKGVFLALLKSADLSPDASSTPADAEKTLASFEKAAETLSNSALTSGSSKELARLMIELAGLQRKDSMETRLNSREMAKAELSGQAEKMKESASEARSGAIAGLVMSVVSSAINIGSSAGAMKGLKDSAGDMGDLAKAQDKLGKLDATKLGQKMEFMDTKATVDTLSSKVGSVQGRVQAMQTGMSGAAGLANSVGSTTQGMTAANAKTMEAEGTEMAADAEVLRSEGDMAREVGQALNEMISQMINFIKEMRNSEVEMMASVTRG